MGTHDLISPFAKERYTLSPEEWTEKIDKAIGLHNSAIEGREGAVRKNAPESAVSIVNGPRFGNVCVKEIKWRGLAHCMKNIIRRSRGLRSFQNSSKLIDSGIRPAAVIALRRVKQFGVVTSEYIIMEKPDHYFELDRHVTKRIQERWSNREKRSLIRAFAGFLGQLHSRGIFHSDLKTCNIMVMIDPGAPDFALLDYDDVIFYRSLPMKRRIKNLTQIFLSTPMEFNQKDRLLFLRLYGNQVGLDPRLIGRLARDILNTAHGRKILYVGLDGDIEEDWEA